MSKQIEEKYADMWLDTNNWEFPVGFEPFKIHRPFTKQEKEMYTSGMWIVLNEMVKDGLISIDVLNKMSDKKSDWKPGTSKIKVI